MCHYLSQHGRLAGFITLNMTNGTAVGLLYMTLPLYALSMHASATQIGMIRGASGLGLLLLVIPAGFLVDHFGTKKLFLIGNSAVLLVIILLTSIKTPGILILLMFIEGLSRSLKFTDISATFFQSLHRFGLEKAGWYKGSLSIGLTFLGPALVGLLLGVVSFDTIFVLALIIMLLPSLFIFFLHTEQHRRTSGEGLKSSTRSQTRDFVAIIQHKGLCLALLAETLCTACLSTFTTFIVIIVVKEWHLKPGMAALLLSLEGGAFILTVFGAGRLVHNCRQRSAYLVSIGVSMAALTGLSLSPTYSLMLVSAVLLGFGLGLINIVTSSCAGGMKGEKGKIASLFAASAGLGNSFGPLVSGVVAQYFSVQKVFFVFVPLLLLLGASIFRQRSDAPEPLQEPVAAFQ